MLHEMINYKETVNGTGKVNPTFEIDLKDEGPENGKTGGNQIQENKSSTNFNDKNVSSKLETDISRDSSMKLDIDTPPNSQVKLGSKKMRLDSLVPEMQEKPKTLQHRCYGIIFALSATVCISLSTYIVKKLILRGYKIYLSIFWRFLGNSQ